MYIYTIRRKQKKEISDGGLQELVALNYKEVIEKFWKILKN